MKLRRRSLPSFAAVSLAVFGMACSAAVAEYSPVPPDPATFPSDAVALVDSTPIQRSLFDRRFSTQERLAERKFKGKARAKMRNAVLTALIQAARKEFELQALGITITEAAVKDRFDFFYAQSFPTAAEYKAFLTQTGQTEADLMHRVRVAMVSERLHIEWVNGAPVSEQEVLDEYKLHPRSHGEPGARDLLLIRTSKRARIRTAMSALRSGQSFARVANRYSEGRERRKDGRFTSVSSHELRWELSRRVFRAKLGKLVGPFKTDYGYYIVKVTKIRRPDIQRFELVEDQIREDLQHGKLAAMTAAFETRWKPATFCRSGFRSKVCGKYVP